MKIESDYVILDVGCGGGKTLSSLVHLACQGKDFGIDYSADMVEHSRKVNKKLIAENRIEICEGSAEKTGFPDNSFDLVTAIETYYFWSSLSDVLQEIKRVLKPAGHMLMVNAMVKDGFYEVEKRRNHRKNASARYPVGGDQENPATRWFYECSSLR